MLHTDINLLPPDFGCGLQVYPPLKQLVRVSGPPTNSVYPGYVQQYDGVTPRDREQCLVYEPNLVNVVQGTYRGRLVGNYDGYPLYAISLLCCVLSSSSSSSSSSSHSSSSQSPSSSSHSSSDQSLASSSLESASSEYLFDDRQWYCVLSGDIVSCQFLTPAQVLISQIVGGPYPSLEVCQVNCTGPPLPSSSLSQSSSVSSPSTLSSGSSSPERKWYCVEPICGSCLWNCNGSVWIVKIDSCTGNCVCVPPSTPCTAALLGVNMEADCG